MSFTFAKVVSHHPRCPKPLEYGWLLRLESPEDVMRYIMEHDPHVRDAINDVWRIQQAGGGHWQNGLSAAVGVICEANGLNFGQNLARLNGERVKTMFEMLPIYLNHRGGFFSVTSKDEELVTRTVKKFKWPKDGRDKIEFKQWTGGRHWYAILNGRGITWEGRDKWNTLKGAKAAYECWRKARG